MGSLRVALIDKITGKLSPTYIPDLSGDYVAQTDKGVAVDVPLPLQATLTAATAPTIGTTQPYDATAGALAPSLPALSGLSVGQRVAVQKAAADASANLVTLTCAGADTFDSGATTLALKVTGELRDLRVVSVGGTKKWKVAGGNTPLSSLDARYVLLAPAPTGNRTTDTANLQALVDAVQLAGGGTVVLRPGTYAADLVTTKQAVQPCIVGQGKKLTFLDGTLKMLGAPGAWSGAELRGFTFSGSHAAATALELQGVCQLDGDIGFSSGGSDAFAIGILFHNYASGDFTEVCRLKAQIGSGVARAVEYRVTSGTNSFHGSGLIDGSLINQSASASQASILIGAGARPYNSPMQVTFWAQNAQPMILHQGSNESSLYGNIKVELLGTNAKAVICDPASTSPLPFAGTISTKGKDIQDGALVRGQSVWDREGTARAVAAGAFADEAALGATLSAAPSSALALAPGGAEWTPAAGRINLATNPSVESGTTNWGTYWTPTAAQSSAWAAIGTYSYQVTTTDNSKNEGITYVEPRSDWTPGEPVTVALTIRTSVDVAMKIQPRATLSGSPGTYEGAASTVYCTANTPRRVVLRYAVPPANSGGTVTGVGFEITPVTASIPAVGSVYQADAVTIERGNTSGSYFDGSANAASPGAIGPALLRLPGTTFGTGALAWVAANKAILNRFEVIRSRAYRYLNFRVDVQSGNIQAGIVRLDSVNPLNFVRVAHTGVIACPAVGAYRADIGGAGGLALPPGDYAHFLWADNTTFQTRWATNSAYTSTRAMLGLSGLASGVQASGTAFYDSNLLCATALEADLA